MPANPPEILYSREHPKIVGRDDGSEPVLVEAWGYFPLRKGQFAYVKGSSVPGLIANGSIAPVHVDDATTPPPGVYPGTQRAGWTEPELGYEHRVGTDADFAALTAEKSHRVTHVAGTVGPAELAEPAPSGPPPADTVADDVPPTPRSRARRNA